MVVEAEPNVTMLDFWNPITLFRQGRTNISVSIPTGLPSGGNVLVAVPWESTDQDVNIKPNPLWLVVTLAEDGKLSLNNEPAGTLSNTGPLSNQLKEIFREREVNGVFREGVNEIEKSVTIVMPMSGRKFADFITIAKAVWLPGGDRIALAMDHPFADFVNVQDEIFNLPPVSPKKKPELNF